MQGNSYNILLKKLDEFIRKYYTNQLIKGVIYCGSIVLAAFILITTFEYCFNASSIVRTFLFYGFLLLTVGVAVKFVFFPLAKIFSFGKRINHQQAANIIGQHFGEVQDKLQNVLQLNEQENGLSSSLLEASISQKIKELKPVPFSVAINFKENTKYLKFLFPPLLILLLIILIAPSIISESANRLVAHNREFVPEAPFVFKLKNNTMQAYSNEDFLLQLEVDGMELPKDVKVSFDEQNYWMTKDNSSSFIYQFKNLQKDVSFRFDASGYTSKEFTIKVLPKPSLLRFDINLNYPSYTGLKNTVQQNYGDIVVPEGTQVKWQFFTENTDKITFSLKDSSIESKQLSENEFVYSSKLYETHSYSVLAYNPHVLVADSIHYNIQVVPDTKPLIELEEKQDSLNPSMLYFKGIVKDDYGFNKLVFRHKLINEEESSELKSEIVPINTELPQTDFFHAWSIASYSLKPGEKIEYYFEIWDNDGVNGSKMTKSARRTFKAPTKKELNEIEEEENDKIKEEINKNIELAFDIKRDMQKLKEKLLNKKSLDFQDKKAFEDLMKRQQQMQKSMQELDKNQKEKNNFQNEFSEMSEELMEKQKLLEELFEKVVSDEMKEMMKEMQEMMDKLQKEDVQEALEKMELNNEEIEKELDRNLELFKQLEFEKKLDDTKKQLDELKEKQKDLKEEGKNKKSDKEALEKKQEELNEEFDAIEKKLEDLKKENKELENPNKMEDTDSMEEQIKKEMKESAEELSKKNSKKASDSQQNAEDKMQELSDKISDMQMQMNANSSQENAEDLRFLLENLIELSFGQEEILNGLKKIDKNDPKYTEFAQEQKKLKDDAQIIKDSLFALSKRVIQLEAVVNKEVAAITYNMDKAIDEMGERNTPVVGQRQQTAMTSINNLALILDDALQEMMKQMQQQSGKGSCSKPGGGKPSAGSMKKMQQQLNKQMQALKDAMQKGQKPGGKKGDQQGMSGSGGKGKSAMSKQLAQMAAKQGALRKALKEMQDQIGEGSGKGAGSLKKIGELMEQTETDLVNKKITNETILRQQDILTRLLESEKAEKEREKDKKRKSNEFTDEIIRNQNAIFEYNKQKQKELELLRTLPPTFTNFYKTKVSEYFNRIQE